MGYPLQIARRYLGGKSRGAFVSVGTAFAIVGVALGVSALLTVMSVTGGFQAEFRKKVLGVNAHVLVMKYSSDFLEYREVMNKIRDVPGVTGVAPFTIKPMMVTHGDHTATGVLLKGVDPELMPTVLDLPQHVTRGSLQGLRRPGAKPPERKSRGGFLAPVTPPPLPGVPVQPHEGDAGAAVDDAGRPKSLMRGIEESIREAERAADAGASKFDSQAREPNADAGIEQELAAIEAETEAEPDLDAGLGPEAPVGSVEPEGGYGSTLPDPTEALPDDVAPDPCASADAVSQLPGLVIGSALAKNLSADIGSCVQVTSPTIGFSYSGGAIRPPVAKQFRVVAVFEAGFDQYDSKLVYADMFEAQSFQEQGDSVTGVEMKVQDINDSKHIKHLIEQRLSSNLYHTMDWEELNHGLFTALRIQQILMSAVLALIIVVAAFTVIATLIMVVLDKKKEISVLKAMGASDVAVLKIFLYQGGLIGATGTAAGLLLGLAVCKGLLIYGFPLDPKVYFISQLPVQVRATEFTITGAIALIICLLATIFPALYAARLRPAEGVRSE